MESGSGEVESDSYWKRKEAFTRGSTVSLAMGERFSSGTVLLTDTLYGCVPNGTRLPIGATFDPYDAIWDSQGVYLSIPARDVLTANVVLTAAGHGCEVGCLLWICWC